MERSVKKAYLAIVEGHVSWDETVASWAIGEDENDPKHFKVFLHPPHPFLPYVAPHVSHISPFILVF